MAHGMLGADTPALRDLGRTLVAAAEGLQSSAAGVEALVYGMQWTGPSADEFRTWWSAVGARGIASAGTLLVETGRQLGASADGQDDASGADGGGGGSGEPGVPPGGRVESATVGENEVTWTLDSEGRPVFVEATLSDVFEALDRSSAEVDAQEDAGDRGIESDHGGHVIAHRFVTDQGIRNMFPQDGNFNTGAYKRMENEFAAWVDHGMEVRAEIQLLPHETDRPAEVAVSYEVVDPDSGRVVYDNNVLFLNQAGQTFDRVDTDDMDGYVR